MAPPMRCLPVASPRPLRPPPPSPGFAPFSPFSFLLATGGAKRRSELARAKSQIPSSKSQIPSWTPGVWDLGLGIWDLGFASRSRAYNARVHIMTTNPDRWATVERLYHSALARPVDERAAFVAEACAGDEELRREVESLLAQEASADGVLTQGGVVAAAGLVTDVGQSVLTGRRRGSYQILAPLGAGGMGEVYRARDARLGRDVAIKILPRAFTVDAGRLARFEREARVLA